jgi:hypothetical protein
MTTSSAPTTWRRMAVTAIAAGAIAVGAGALSAQAANAESREWDIGAYDKCAATNPHIDPDKYMDHFHYCCIQSGGDWDASKGKCVAPPANAPGRTVPPGAITHTLTPLAPSPGDITQTFTPAP